MNRIASSIIALTALAASASPAYAAIKVVATTEDLAALTDQLLKSSASDSETRA